MVVAKVRGVKRRALLHTRAGSSCTSAVLLNLLHVHPYQSEVRQIEMMLGAVTKRVEIFKCKPVQPLGNFA